MTKFKRNDFLKVIEELEGLSSDCALADVLKNDVPQSPETGWDAVKKRLTFKRPNPGVSYHTHPLTGVNLRFALYHDRTVEPLWAIGKVSFRPESEYEWGKSLRNVADRLSRENYIMFDQCRSISYGYRFHDVMADLPRGEGSFDWTDWQRTPHIQTLDDFSESIRGIRTAQSRLSEIVRKEEDRLYRIEMPEEERLIHT